jgi:hypothetical protein
VGYEKDDVNTDVDAADPNDGGERASGAGNSSYCY